MLNRNMEKEALINERDRYRAALIRCIELSGEDMSDGIPTWPPLDEWAVQCVQQLRDDYDDAI